jgi:hypothetical protein
MVAAEPSIGSNSGKISYWFALSVQTCDHGTSKELIYEQKEYVFLGAGAIGCTEILLRSKACGLSMSPLAGCNISGNGDMLSLGYDTNRIINSVGREKIPKGDTPCGPAITGVINNGGSVASPHVLDAHIIQEGAIPAALAPLIQFLLDQCPDRGSITS